MWGAPRWMERLPAVRRNRRATRRIPRQPRPPPPVSRSAGSLLSAVSGIVWLASCGRIAGDHQVGGLPEADSRLSRAADIREHPTGREPPTPIPWARGCAAKVNKKSPAADQQIATSPMRDGVFQNVVSATLANQKRSTDIHVNT
jgi:hypothetical protein